MIDSRALVVLAVLGAVAGLFLAEVDVDALGLVVGAAIVYLLALVARLQRRVDELEQEARRREFAALARPAAEPAAPAAPAAAPPMAAAPPAGEPAAVQPAAARPAAPLAEASRWEAERPRKPAIPPEVALATETPPSPALAPNVFDTALAAARAWLTTGNVPVKIGVIVSFFGVAFLLKYAVDRQLLVFPVELRLLAVAAAAIALLVIGWRLRERTRVYALSLQGGGIGILYLTIFAALRLYSLLPPVLAFGLLFVLAVAGGALAVLQNARGLATLGAVGGFLAPILVSTGTGSHVVLFTYYLVLNALIVGVAWFKPWRELNLLGFAFTFVIGGLWGYRNFTPDMLGSTEPFVVLFFLFYQATAILFALRQPPDLRGLVDGALVFGTPVLAFALQAVLLRDTEYGLAFSALGAALFYVTAATWLHRVQPQALRLLIESFLSLAVAFGTLAIPLALDARWTSAAWALEGAALVWIGTRQGRPLARAAGVALVIGAGMAFLDYGWQHGRGPPILNGNLLGGWLIALAGFFVTRQLERSPGRFAMLEAWVGRIVFVASALWWLGAGAAEIADRLPRRQEFGAVVLFLAASAALSSLAAARLDWMLARRASFAALPLLALPAAAIALAGSHPGASLGALAWPVAILLQYWLLRRDEGCLGRLLAFCHALLAGLATALLMWEVHWQARHGGLSQVWALSLAAAIPGGLLLGVLQLRGRLTWPVAAHRAAYAIWVCGVLFALQALPVVFLNIGTDGAATPLAYVPLVNPVDLETAFALLCTLYWLQALGGLEGPRDAAMRRMELIGLGAAAFAASTLALLRAVHHLGGVPWQWYSLSSSVLVQAALSVYWGLLGFVAMVAGARGARRWLWLTGAALMGVVVAKLFLVDLGNTGTVARIVSFIATGALLLVVGYLAPAPPRLAEDRNA